MPDELLRVQAVAQPLVDQPQRLLEEVETAADRWLVADCAQGGHEVVGDGTRRRLISGITRLPGWKIERLRRLLKSDVVP